MTRTPVPQDTEVQVLLLSRRRCCICFGLRRDTQLKQGQIAHLDHNNSNNDLDNLAFLCLAHHDQYDSRTSQSKGLKEHEVKQFRIELYEMVSAALAATVKFGEIELTGEGIAGRYVRDGSGDWVSAELQVTLLPDGKVKVNGLSLYGITRQYGPNFGELNFDVPLSDGRKVIFEDPKFEYRIKLTFENGFAFAEERLPFAYFGMNVTFAGMYRKVADLKDELPALADH